MTTLSQFQLDWLNGLMALARGLERHAKEDVHQINDSWAPILSEASHLLIDFDNERKAINVNLPDFTSLPEIERIEIMAYAATAAWAVEYMYKNPERVLKNPSEGFMNLCRRVGCWHTNTPTVSERWRLMDFYQAANTLPLAGWETRCRCVICNSPVATDAGAWVDADSPEARRYMDTKGFGNWKAQLGQLYRPDIHLECRRYVHRVLMPELAELRRVVAATKPAEVDK